MEGKNKRNLGEYIKKYKWLLAIWGIYFLLTIVLTFLYNNCPMIFSKGLFGQDGFYSGFITNMYNTCLEFLLLTVIVAVISEKRDSESSRKRFHEEIENCRHWEDAEATYKIRARILELNRMGDKEINLSQCHLENVILKKLDLVNSSFKGSNLAYSNIENGKFEKCVFMGTALNNSKAYNDEFLSCTLKNVKFEDSNIKSAAFHKCIIQRTDFSNSDLSNTHFDNCDLKECKFTNCNLERTVFKNCKNLDVDSLLKAKIQRYTYVDKEYYDDICRKVKAENKRFRTSQNSQ